MVKVKICGIKRIEDVKIVNVFMPDYVGFVFAKSKRSVSIEEAQELISKLDPNIKRVGVFVNESYETVLSTAKSLNLDVLQFHGNEDNDYIKRFKKYEIWKAISIGSEEDIKKANLYNADVLLMDTLDGDTKGGTGKSFNWSMLEKSRDTILRPVFVAGGLNDENVEKCIDRLHPFGVDISSGVESNGVKDKLKIKNFIMKVRNFK